MSSIRPVDRPAPRLPRPAALATPSRALRLPMVALAALLASPTVDAGTLGDFNGDGYDDLVVGVPYEALGSLVAGFVHVIYGGPGGLTAFGNEGWGQNHPAVPGDAETADLFGSAVTVGDFNADGYDDLAIGAPGEDVGSVDSAGAVNVLYGTAAGLHTAGAQLWHQDSFGIWGIAEAGDRFGSALTNGDFNGDGYDDLAVGIPGDRVASTPDAGAVQVLNGTLSGLAWAGNLLLHQNTSGIGDAPETNDHFGWALAADDFTGDGFDELVIGVPAEITGSSPISLPGIVHVLLGDSSGLSGAGSVILDPARAGCAGYSLATGDLDGDGFRDLAVGAPAWGAGRVQIYYGDSSLLFGGGNTNRDQDAIAASDGAESGDFFGHAVTAGDFNHDGVDDLAVGVPFESREPNGPLTGLSAYGVVNIFFGSVFGFQSGTQRSTFNEANALEGWSLAAGDFNGDGADELVVGAPWQRAGSVAFAGNLVVHEALASETTWNQLSSGLAATAETGDRFGWHVGGSGGTLLGAPFCQ